MFNPSRVSELPQIDLPYYEHSVSNPIQLGIIKSPCRSRPENFAPCPLIKYPKNNVACDGCSLLKKGKVTLEVIKQMLLDGPLKLTAKENYCGEKYAHGESHVCSMPWCKKMVIGHAAYCGQCSTLIANRRGTWRFQGNTGRPTKEYLERPRGVRTYNGENR
ncbi:MAG: hypothetical protein WAU91_20640 [Desulfatitalea sp.]